MQLSSFDWSSHNAFQQLEGRIKAILPELYQDCYEEVQPVSMGSAGLRFDDDGNVAWDKIWGSFCDLAMAGGPPHKGKLLLPATPEEIAEQPAKHNEVVAELCRGIGLVTRLEVEPASSPGWVKVTCDSPAMAGWLLRAITMENVAADAENSTLLLPAGPAYRLEKEIKNVITSIAKTSHYWVEHMWLAQQREIRQLFQQWMEESPLLQPLLRLSAADGEVDARAKVHLAEEIVQGTGLAASSYIYPGWLGLQCPGVASAIWMMRALVASNVLSRREETVLFVPCNPVSDPDGQRLLSTLGPIHGLARKANVL